MDHSQLSKGLLEIYNNDVDDCLSWLNSPHQLLDGLTPLDRIQEDGDTDAVMVLVAQVLDGAFV